ncbi:MAG TPA: DUF4381 domain-containing protein [Rhodanobacteraceae bacterium]|nr:DUF4381 domain-containing protein [Rhodanobacteraceae bacterium]
MRLPQSLAPQPAGGPQLRDIHMPPAPGWWPLAPGWWIVLALLLLACAVAGWLLWRWRARRRRWRAIAAELDVLAEQHAREGDAARLASGLSRLLRRVARRLGGDPHLEGRAWQAELERLVPGAMPPHLAGELSLAQYRPSASLDVDAALAACRRWLRAAARRRHG